VRSIRLRSTTSRLTQRTVRRDVASWNAVAATSRAILGLLEDAYPRDLFGTLAFDPVHASDIAGEASIADGFTLCLYRVGINMTLRNLPPRLAEDGTRYKPSLPLDLHYLLTPWAAKAETQQRLLGWGMRAIEDNPILPSGLLNKYLREPDVFRSDESVELVSDPLGLADYTNLWDKLKPRLQTSMTYVARMVLIDSDLALRDGRAVQTRTFELARVMR
jgi:hypothetical protein